MKARNLLFLILMVFCGTVTALAQSEPNLEVGFKPYGSYHGSEVDTVGLMNGNLTLHIPLPGHYPQRGGQLDSQALLVMNSKTWRLQYPEGACQGNDCLPFWNLNPGWTPAALASGDTLQPKIGRTYQVDSDAQGNLIFSAWGYFITGWDGMRHELMDVSNGNLTALEAVDASGWRVNMNATSGVPTTGTVLDGHGNQYQIQFSTPALAGPYARSPVCSTTTDSTPISNGDNAPLLHLTPDFTSQCNQAAAVLSVTDANGNLYQFNGTTDTLGRQYSSTGSFANTTDLSGCVSALPVSSPATITTYSGPNGVVNQIKTCFSLVNVQTNFGVSGTREWPIQSGGSQTLVPVTILLPDGTWWTLSYDNYGNVTSMGLPLGGTVSYQWSTVAFPNIGNTPVSRVVTQRTITDNLGHSSIWHYQWMTQQSNPAPRRLFRYIGRHLQGTFPKGRLTLRMRILSNNGKTTTISRPL